MFCLSMKNIFEKFCLFTKAQPSKITQEAEAAFGENEIKEIKEVFRNVSKKSGFIKSRDFILWHEMVNIDKSFTHSLCININANKLSHKDIINYEDFIVYLKQICKGSSEEKLGFIFNVLKIMYGVYKEVLDRKEIYTFVHICCKSAFEISNKSSIIDHEFNNICDAISQGAFYSTDKKESINGLNLYDFISWMSQVEILYEILYWILTRKIFSKEKTLPPIIIPRLRIYPQINRESLLLSDKWSWLLCPHLKPFMGDNWDLLFSSSFNGNSYNTLYKNIKERGSTLFIIKDDKDYEFGAFASCPISKNGQFYGDSLSFLFKINPQFSIFKPSNKNSNYIWCGKDFKELPNGIGFGGLISYFGLFISESFENGESRPCNTYSNPCLASSEEFVIKDIECWLIKSSEDTTYTINKNSISILDSHKEDRNVLELYGKGLHSDGYRD